MSILNSAPASLIEVKKYFEYQSTTEFSDDWKKMTAKDAEQIKEGIGNDTFTY
jgi:hypothetical protein